MLDRYHGIGAFYDCLLTPQDDALSRHEPMLARERLDWIGTPIFSFPLNSID